MIELLVTGASGVSGREIARHFRGLPDFRVITTNRGLLDGHHVPHDLLEPLPIGSGMFPERIDAIIHTAAEVDEASTDCTIIHRNVSAMSNIVAYARAAGAKAFVNLSSVSLYGPVSGRVSFDEESIPRPPSLYAQSKLLSERVTEELTGTRVSHLRLAYVLGAGLKDYTAVHRLYSALAADAPVTLVNEDTNRLQFIDTRDIAEICERLIREGCEGIFNCAASERPTISQIFEVLRQLVPENRSFVTQLVDPGQQVDVEYRTALLRAALPGTKMRSFSQSLVYALTA